MNSFPRPQQNRAPQKVIHDHSWRHCGEVPQAPRGPRPQPPWVAQTQDHDVAQSEGFSRPPEEELQQIKQELENEVQRLHELENLHHTHAHREVHNVGSLQSENSSVRMDESDGGEALATGDTCGETSEMNFEASQLEPTDVKVPSAVFVYDDSLAVQQTLQCPQPVTQTLHQRRGCSAHLTSPSAAEEPSSERRDSKEMPSPTRTEKQPPTRTCNRRSPHQPAQRGGWPQSRRASPHRRPTSAQPRKRAASHGKVVSGAHATMRSTSISDPQHHHNCRRRSAPEWDFTNSDMSRYQLTRAEQLRRHLLRISKHREEAARNVQQKLRCMQEDIAPFVGQESSLGAAGERSSSSTCHQRRRMNMTPCFASRVPTGRIPDKNVACVLDDASSPQKRTSRSAEFSTAPNVSAVAAGARVSPVPDDAKGASGNEHCSIDGQYPLDEALAVELANFRSMSEPQAGAARPSSKSAPEYKVLRKRRPTSPRGGVSYVKSSSLAAAEEARTTICQKQQVASAKKAALVSSDVDLDDIEEGAAALEAQLSWWRQQEEAIYNAARAATMADSSYEQELEQNEFQYDRRAALAQDHEMTTAEQSAELQTESRWLDVADSGARYDAITNQGGKLSSVQPSAVVDGSLVEDVLLDSAAVGAALTAISRGGGAGLAQLVASQAEALLKEVGVADAQGVDVQPEDSLHLRTATCSSHVASSTRDAVSAVVETPQTVDVARRECPFASVSMLADQSSASSEQDVEVPVTSDRAVESPAALSAGTPVGKGSAVDTPSASNAVAISSSHSTPSSCPQAVTSEPETPPPRVVKQLVAGSIAAAPGVPALTPSPLSAPAGAAAKARAAAAMASGKVSVTRAVVGKAVCSSTASVAVQPGNAQTTAALARRNRQASETPPAKGRSCAPPASSASRRANPKSSSADCSSDGQVAAEVAMALDAARDWAASLGAGQQSCANKETESDASHQNSLTEQTGLQAPAVEEHEPASASPSQVDVASNSQSVAAQSSQRVGQLTQSRRRRQQQPRRPRSNSPAPRGRAAGATSPTVSPPSQPLSSGVAVARRLFTDNSDDYSEVPPFLRNGDESQGAVEMASTFVQPTIALEIRDFSELFNM